MALDLNASEVPGTPLDCKNIDLNAPPADSPFDGIPGPQPGFTGTAAGGRRPPTAGCTFVDLTLSDSDEPTGSEGYPGQLPPEARQP